MDRLRIMTAAGSLAWVFGVAFACSLVLTWVVRGAMLRAGIVDRPSGGRKTHGRPVAYEGGIALFMAFLAGLVAAAWVSPEFFFARHQIVGLVIGAALIVCVGVADDLLDLNPWIKLVAQCLVALLMCRFGFRIERLSNPLGGHLPLPQFVSIGGTVIWYALLMNAINMIDGLDGLAAGIVAITGVTLLAISANLGQELGMFVAAATVGCCLGFLPFNFKPASIFMGDAGALFLGFLLATLTLLSSTKAPALLALLVPMLAVGLPVFDTVFAFFRRLFTGKHPFRGDRRHLHHRFVALGFSDRRTVLIFYYITAYFGVTAFVLQRLEARSTLALVAIIGVGMLLLVENMRYLERLGQEREDPGEHP